MSLGNVIMLSAIVFAFTLFAVVLAWCDFYTRGASKKNGKQPLSPSNEENRFKNAA